MVKAAEILPVLDDIIGFVGDVFKAHEASQSKVAQLQEQLKQKDKVILEKVATNVPDATKVAFDKTKVQEMIGHLKCMNIINDDMGVKIAADLEKDPNTLLNLTTRISEALLNSPTPEGGGIAKEAASDGSDDSDPDGWGAFAQGRPVKLKRY